MPVPTLLTDLSTTPASNYPAGSDAPSTIDDTLRAHAALMATLRDRWSAFGLTLTDDADAATARTTLGFLDKPVFVSGSAARTTVGTFTTYSYETNSGLGFNTATGVYTVPSTGFYLVSMVAETQRIASTPGNTTVSVRVGANSAINVSEWSSGQVGELHTLTGSGVVYATAGQSSDIYLAQVHIGVDVRVKHLSYIKIG